MCDLSSFSRRHGVSKSLLAAALIAVFVSPSRSIAADQPDTLALNFHLMHPGGDSKPGDPNAAFYLDGTYHLHYILVHDWTVEGKTRKGFSFVHVTSPDMLHWTWQKTKLQPTFTEKRNASQKAKPRYSSNAPHSGGKATAAEGGFRVPTIAWWPGTIEAESSTDLMASTMDLLPAFAALAGKPFVSKVPIDGLDISCLFGDQLPTSSPRNTFAYYGYFNAEYQYREADQVLLHAVREGRWKYYPKPTRFLGVGTEEYLEIPAGALYDLDADPGEMSNLANNHPDVVTRLKTLAQTYVRELGDEGQIGSGVRKAAFVKEGTPMNYSR